jgi:hypothetical protein
MSDKRLYKEDGIGDDTTDFGMNIKTPIVVRGYPNFVGYSYVGVYNPREETNDTTDEAIFRDILRKYSGAWEKLAKM